MLILTINVCIPSAKTKYLSPVLRKEQYCNSVEVGREPYC